MASAPASWGARRPTVEHHGIHVHHEPEAGGSTTAVEGLLRGPSTEDHTSEGPQQLQAGRTYLTCDGDLREVGPQTSLHLDWDLLSAGFAAEDLCGLCGGSSHLLWCWLLEQQLIYSGWIIRKASSALGCPLQVEGDRRANMSHGRCLPAHTWSCCSDTRLHPRCTKEHYGRSSPSRLPNTWSCLHLYSFSIFCK